MAKKPAPDSTGMKQGGAARFRPGQSGNPKGRPKGSRNKLGEDFLTDLLEVWGERGKECIEATAANHPEKLVSIVAGLLPKELNVSTNPLEQMSDEDLEHAIAEVKLYLQLNGVDPGPDDEPSVKHYTNGQYSLKSIIGNQTPCHGAEVGQEPGENRDRPANAARKSRPCSSKRVSFRSSTC